MPRALLRVYERDRERAASCPRDHGEPAPAAFLRTGVLGVLGG